MLLATAVKYITCCWQYLYPCLTYACQLHHLTFTVVFVFPTNTVNNIVTLLVTIDALHSFFCYCSFTTVEQFSSKTILWYTGYNEKNTTLWIYTEPTEVWLCLRAHLKAVVLLQCEFPRANNVQSENFLSSFPHSTLRLSEPGTGESYS